MFFYLFMDENRTMGQAMFADLGLEQNIYQTQQTLI